MKRVTFRGKEYLMVPDLRLYSNEPGICDMCAHRKDLIQSYNTLATICRAMRTETQTSCTHPEPSVYIEPERLEEYLAAAVAYRIDQKFGKEITS